MNFRGEQLNMEHEHGDSQEIIKLEHRVMHKYFELAGIPREMHKEWVETYGASLRTLAETKREFLEAFAQNSDVTKEELEEELSRYIN